MVSSIAEAIAHGASAIIVNILSIKKGFATSFFVCGFSCILVIISEISETESLIPVAVLGAKAGIACAFAFLYFSTVSYFTSAFLGLVMGFSNTVGRLSTVAAPIVAE